MFDAAFAAQDAAINLAATAASSSSKDMAVPREWVYGAFVFMGLAVIGMATDAKKPTRTHSRNSVMRTM